MSPGLAKATLPLALGIRLAVWAAYRLDVPGTAAIGRRVRVTGRDVTVHPHARVGDDCVIEAHVKIGAPARETEQREPLTDAPTVGRGVRLGEGCCVVGPVTIGDHAVIGPYTTISTNVADGARVDASQPHGQVHLRLAQADGDSSVAQAYAASV